MAWYVLSKKVPVIGERDHSFISIQRKKIVPLPWKRGGGKWVIGRVVVSAWLRNSQRDRQIDRERDRERTKMSPASLLDWSEPRQQWRYPKGMTVATRIHNSQTIKMQSRIDLNDKEADTAYKKICKFLRRLKSNKCESKYNIFLPSFHIYF